VGAGLLSAPGSTSFHIEGRGIFFQFGICNRKIVRRPKEAVPAGCLTQMGRARSVQRRRSNLKVISGFPEPQEQRPGRACGYGRLVRAGHYHTEGEDGHP
jgi:hypothetical protein